jgi:hypothetical protein
MLQYYFLLSIDILSYSKLREQYNTNRICRSSRTTSYDLNRARFVGPETEKTGRLDTHTVPLPLALLSFTIGFHCKLVS